MRARILGWFLVALLAPVAVQAQSVTVAAAADLQAVLPEIVSQFQKDTGKTVQVVYGSSGNLAQQIQNGAPFDMFFSANLDYAKKLEAGGFAEPGSLYEYAVGKIVLWVPADSKLELGRGLQALANPGVHKIAIANPEHAPYGQAAVAAMKKAGVYEKVSEKLVLGESISQAASFVASGAADAGILALSLALSPNLRDKGRYAEIASTDYPAIEQACVIVKASARKQDAAAFLAYFKTAQVRELLTKYGFGAPPAR